MKTELSVSFDLRTKAKHVTGVVLPCADDRDRLLGYSWREFTRVRYLDQYEADRLEGSFLHDVHDDLGTVPCDLEAEK